MHVVYKNNRRACMDIKTEKSTRTRLVWYLSEKIKHHFHITTLNRYSFFVFAFTLAIHVFTYMLLCGSGFNCVAKVILFLCFFGF